MFEENSIKSIGRVTITQSGTIRIDGDFKVGDGVLINPNSTRSRAAGSGEYYLTDNGYYLVMAAEDGSLEFDAAAMGLSKGQSVAVGVFDNSNDFVITKEENIKNNVNNVTEEYYYVDFSSDEFKNLNPEDIIIRQVKHGGQEKFSIITDNEILTTPSKSVDYSTQSGIGIIQTWIDTVNDNDSPFRIHVVTPVDIKADNKKLLSLSCSPSSVSIHLLSRQQKNTALKFPASMKVLSQQWQQTTTLQKHC